VSRVSKAKLHKVAFELRCWHSRGGLSSCRLVMPWRFVHGGVNGGCDGVGDGEGRGEDGGDGSRDCGGGSGRSSCAGAGRVGGLPGESALAWIGTAGGASDSGLAAGGDGVGKVPAAWKVDITKASSSGRTTYR
jgi:hypothetical protein